MKKVLRLFVGLLYLFTLLCPSVFATTTCHTDIVDRVPVETCTTDPEPGEHSEPSGETPKDCPNGCCGIRLNTNFPIIGNCIETKDATNAFPSMMGALTKIIMSLIFVVCFIFIIVAGVIRAGAGEDSAKVKKAKGLLMRVAITILLLGFSGAILKLINPNFFG